MSEQRRLDRDAILKLVAAFRPACVIGAGAELDVYTPLAREPLAAGELAARLGCDGRGMRTLLDALAALGVLEKAGERYALAAQLVPVLSSDEGSNVLPGIWHSMNVLRGWTELARVVKTGEKAAKRPSVRGEQADRAAFIGAMHTGSGPVADEVVRRIPDLAFRTLLDVGGASGSWTIAFLRAVPGSKAILFDLPHAVVQARARLASEGLLERVRLVEGDFYLDDLPGGADLAWVSAIAHQHSRERNRALFRKVHAALVPGGRVAIRDMVMDESRTRPVAGALFAVNMLVNTEGGGTYTFSEYAEDLRAAGFVEPLLVSPADDMNGIVTARKPA